MTTFFISLLKLLKQHLALCKVLGILMLLFASVALTEVLAQTEEIECLTVEEPEPESEPSFCRDLINYFPNPDDPTTTPPSSLVIYINVHFILDSNGQGNFTPTNEVFGHTGLTYAEALRTIANDRLANLTQYSLKPQGVTNPTNPDSGIRYEFYTEPNNQNDLYGGIWFWNNQEFYDNFTANSSSGIHISLNQTLGQYTGKVLNIWIGEGQDANIQNSAYGSPVSGVVMEDAYSHFLLTQGNLFSTARIFRHEMGHVLGLGHPYNCNGNFCGSVDLDVFEECNSPNDPPDNCSSSSTGPGSQCDPIESPSNNMLGNNYDMNSLTDCQIGYVYATALKYFYGYTNLEKCEISEPDRIIATGKDVDWRVTKHLRGNVIIEPGARLHIYCDVFMPKNSTITVKPGGELYIYEGIQITKSCEENWQGIIVEGDPDQHQDFDFPNNGFFRYQGYVSIYGAKISDADKGIDIKPGGIVRAFDTHFFKNVISAHFRPYTYIDPVNGNLVNNKSNFEKCNFSTGFTINKPLVGYVNLESVYGIDFLNCDFWGDGSDEDAYGIYSIDANFSVFSDNDCNITDFNNCEDKSSIRDLKFGIYALNGASTNSFKADRTRFIHNRYGIYSVSVDYTSITRNYFVPNYSPISEGVALYNGTGFTIQENIFTEGGFNATTIGLRISDSGADDNLVKNNIFKNDLDYANLANGINRGFLDLPSGLLYECNEHTNNDRDISVTGSATISDIRLPAAGSLGIKTQQGSFNLPAGNTFSYNNTISPSDINDDVSPMLLYFYNQFAANEEPIDISPNIFTFPVSDEINSCEKIFGGDEHYFTNLQINTFKSHYYQNKIVADSLKSIYYTKIDGGNTSSLLNEIESADEASSSELQDSLIGISPYLSYEVLSAYINRTDLWEDQKMMQVIEGNPDIFKRTDFIDNLLQREIPFDSLLLDSLKNLQFIATPRTILESDFASHNGIKTEMLNYLTQSILLDTTSTDVDSLEYWLNERNNLTSKMDIVDLYIQQGKLTEATSYLDSIPVSLVLSQNEVLIYDDYKAVKDLIISIFNDKRYLDALDSTELSQLYDLADEGVGRGSIQAQNILNYFYGASYFSDPIFPGVPPSFRQVRVTNSKSAIKVGIVAFPNPSRGIVNFAIEMPQKVGFGEIQVFDVNGDLKYSQKVVAKDKTVIWNTSDLPAGLYFYKLYTDNKSNETAVRKLVLIK